MKITLAETLAVAISAVALAVSIMSRQDSVNSVESDWHSQLRGCLESLASLERHGFESLEVTSCGPEDNECLGNLAMKRAYRDQYQLITAEAVDLAQRIPARVTAAELLGIASALYNAGDLTQSSEYVHKLLKKSPSFLVRYRTILLQARIAFFRRELDEGPKRISEADALINSASALTQIEKQLLCAETHLICTNMHLALGLPKDGLRCLRNVHQKLTDLPRTPFVDQLNQSIRAQLTQAIMMEKSPPAMTFDQLEAMIRQQLEEAENGPSFAPLPTPRDEPTPAPAAPPAF